MNFMTNFGLTSNTKSCAIFNSECMLVFAACSLPSRENQVQPRISHSSLVERSNKGIPHYVFMVSNC